MNFKTFLSEQHIMTENVIHIFQDMDGCLTDFQRAFSDLIGENITPDEYQLKYGENAFWGIIGKEGKDFWANMEWMRDGKDLWKFIARYTPKILSAPSSDPSCIEGKVEWLKRNLPELNPDNYTTSLRRLGDERVIFNPNKYMAVLHDKVLKNLAGEIKTRGRQGTDVSLLKKQFDNRRKLFILIDDTPKKIQAWIDAGGTGILHTDANTTIKQLRNTLKENMT